jgi:hypothetical protein
MTTTNDILALALTPLLLIIIPAAVAAPNFVFAAVPPPTEEDSSSNSIIVVDNIQKMTAAVDHLRHQVEDLVNEFKLLKEEVK